MRKDPFAIMRQVAEEENAAAKQAELSTWFRAILPDRGDGADFIKLLAGFRSSQSPLTVDSSYEVWVAHDHPSLDASGAIRAKQELLADFRMLRPKLAGPTPTVQVVDDRHLVRAFELSAQRWRMQRPTPRSSGRSAGRKSRGRGPDRSH